MHAMAFLEPCVRMATCRLRQRRHRSRILQQAGSKRHAVAHRNTFRMNSSGAPFCGHLRSFVRPEDLRAIVRSASGALAGDHDLRSLQHRNVD